MQRIADDQRAGRIEVTNKGKLETALLADIAVPRLPCAAGNQLARKENLPRAIAIANNNPAFTCLGVIAVKPAAAIQHIGAATGDKRIVATAAQQPVIAAAAVKRVRAKTALEIIVAGPSAQAVVAGGAEQAVTDSRPAGDQRLAVAAEHNARRGTVKRAENNIARAVFKMPADRPGIDAAVDEVVIEQCMQHV